MKTFADQDELWDFFVSTEKQQACIMFKFLCSGQYLILCHGFFVVQRIFIYPLGIKKNRPVECSGKIEAYDQPDWELVCAGFDEISAHLSKSLKAV
jgi:hypothetical protein